MLFLAKAVSMPTSNNNGGKVFEDGRWRRIRETYHVVVSWKDRLGFRHTRLVDNVEFYNVQHMKIGTEVVLKETNGEIQFVRCFN
jgi:hypothetical protein